MDDMAVRQSLAELLRGGQAHLDPASALEKVDPQLRGKRPTRLRSVWEELEHMRIAQEDILRYTLDESWKSPKFPAGYWPKPEEEPSDAAFAGSVARFLRDLDATIGLAMDESRDLTAKIPHGEGRTYLRQLLLIADHNAYHLGQIVAIRKLLGDWKS
jgi:uncharacterized damage-inducible protein DinB